MKYDHIVTANAALEATADHMEQMAAFHIAEAEKLKGVAKNLRLLASKEGAPTDPKIEPKPTTAYTLPRVSTIRSGVGAGDSGSIQSIGTSPSEPHIEAARA